MYVKTCSGTGILYIVVVRIILFQTYINMYIIICTQLVFLININLVLSITVTAAVLKTLKKYHGDVCLYEVDEPNSGILSS